MLSMWKKSWNTKDTLASPGMDQKAADIQQVMRELHDELAAYPEIENKKVSAMNNKLKRMIGDADNAGARRNQPDQTCLHLCQTHRAQLRWCWKSLS